MIRRLFFVLAFFASSFFLSLFMLSSPASAASPQDTFIKNVDQVTIGGHTFKNDDPVGMVKFIQSLSGCNSSVISQYLGGFFDSSFMLITTFQNGANTELFISKSYATNGLNWGADYMGYMTNNMSSVRIIFTQTTNQCVSQFNMAQSFKNSVNQNFGFFAAKGLATQFSGLVYPTGYEGNRIVSTFSKISLDDLTPEPQPGLTEEQLRNALSESLQSFYTFMIALSAVAFSVFVAYHVVTMISKIGGRA